MILRALTLLGTSLAVGLTVHTVVNARTLRTPVAPTEPIEDPVSVLVPARNEEHAIGACLQTALAQRGIGDLEVLVLDDRSNDGTAAVVSALAQTDDRLRLLHGEEPPPHWLGKPHACATLARSARGKYLCFVDADVRLRPDAVAAAVDLSRRSGLDLVSPYPRQVAEGLGPRLVQPLLQWSWLTTLPLRLAERSARPSLAAANGQFLLVGRDVYERAGGHGSVRAEVIDDVALLRAVKRAGGTGGVVDGTHLAECQMYESWETLRAGYEKSLWQAFGSRSSAALVMALLCLCYVVPPLAALRGDRVGAVGYGAAVIGRVVVARRTCQRVLPDVLAHPASIGVLTWLTWQSWRGHDRGELTWKGRTVVVAA